MTKRDPSRLANLLAAASDPDVQDDYLHWDELRRRKGDAPTPLSLEDWWFALKIRRGMVSEPLPLLDKHGQPFQYTIPLQMLEQLREIDLQIAGLAKVPDPILNPDTKQQYFLTSLIQEAITSSQLEGAATTRRVADEMLRTKRKPKNQSERMIANNYETMRWISEQKDKLLTRDMVLEIHRLITADTLDNKHEEGRLRRADERIRVMQDGGEILHDPPPADQLKSRLRAMCDFANEATPDRYVHPVIRSIILHFWLGYDHPFVDGNGRTARALFYWSMLHSGYGLIKYISISDKLLKAPSRYTRAYLYSETDDNDVTYFILYHLSIIDQAYKALQALVRDKTRAIRSLEKLKFSSRLNARQKALVSHALKNPGFRYTIKEHRTHHNVVPETSRLDLVGLVDLGLLVDVKEGRSRIFIPIEDLEGRISRME